jgi:hypothetical protein
MSKESKEIEFKGSILKELRNKAVPLDPELLKEIQEQAKKQADLPKLNNPFKTARKSIIEEYLKKQV